jgi:hypothetical protein
VKHCRCAAAAAAAAAVLAQVLVLEHLSGGEMLQQLQRVKRYTEAHACQLFRQVRTRGHAAVRSFYSNPAVLSMSCKPTQLSHVSMPATCSCTFMRRGWLQTWFLQPCSCALCSGAVAAVITFVLVLVLACICRLLMLWRTCTAWASCTGT